MIKQTAGRNQLGDFAPKFAHYNDDILFGENWKDQSIDLKTRSIITVVALMSSGITDNSLKYHLENAKKNGVTKEEMVGIITHTAFYVGWPKGWAVFNLAKEVYKDDEKEEYESFFGLGEENKAYEKYFTGKSYLNPLTDMTKTNLFIANVTFEHHSFDVSSPGTSTAKCENQESFLAPCQCFTSAEIVITIPGFRLMASFPSS